MSRIAVIGCGSIGCRHLRNLHALGQRDLLACDPVESTRAAGLPLAARIQTGSYLPGWRPQQDYPKSYSATFNSAGAVLDCIHEIDLALWYLGTAKLLGAGGLRAVALGLETDGLAEIILRHDSGAISNLNLNFIQCDYKRGCQIVCAEGTIYWDFKERIVMLFGATGNIESQYEEPAEWQANQMYLDEMQHFLEAIKNGTPAFNPLEGRLDAL